MFHSSGIFANMTYSKKLLTVATLVVLVASNILVFPSVSFAKKDKDDDKKGNSGSIWTTNGDCGIETQDVNQFVAGQTVYINGSNFDSNSSLDWSITGKPGNASDGMICSVCAIGV
jgi:hypothetical protein